MDAEALRIALAALDDEAAAIRREMEDAIAEARNKAAGPLTRIEIRRLRLQRAVWMNATQTE